MMNAKTIANYLIYIMSDMFDDLTNAKINKLLYFAQGHYLKKYNTPLFNEAIEAGEQGPVVPEVYAFYREYGDSPVTEYDITVAKDVTPEAEEVLYAVARTYGKYTDSALQEMTQVAGSPWDLTYQKGETHAEIPLTLIQSCFNEREDLTPAEKTFQDDDFIGYRDQNGLLVLPKEWDD